jgi:hypothetical protein
MGHPTKNNAFHHASTAEAPEPGLWRFLVLPGADKSPDSEPVFSDPCLAWLPASHPKCQKAVMG